MAERGHQVHLFSLHAASSVPAGVELHPLPFAAPWGYYLNAVSLRRALAKLSPDLLHAHYATGYGTLGRLSGFRPRLLSVWGSDVYLTPYKTWWGRRLVRRNLRSYDGICSTSQAMAEQTRSIWPGLSNLAVTPFGIDTVQFSPDASQRDLRWITMGTVKTLHPTYGLDLLIRGFAEARRRLGETSPAQAERLRLLLVGKGPEKARLLALVNDLRLGDVTTFTGAVPHADVPRLVNRLDIYVAMSRSESFGVAVLEASACEVPVVVSRVGGLPEVVVDGVTGFVVAPEQVAPLADVLVQLALDPQLRQRLGVAGRQHVVSTYAWVDSVTQMERVYARLLAGRLTQVARGTRMQ